MAVVIGKAEDHEAKLAFIEYRYELELELFILQNPDAGRISRRYKRRGK